MSASALLAGVAVGGVRYGYIKFQLHERENVVQYSVDAVKQAFHGEPKRSVRADERYVSLPTREHEYYTYIRESWNSKVLGFRDSVLEILQAKKRRSSKRHHRSAYSTADLSFLMSSSSSTYFQGGDYVELLSAQGKAPAATWKLHGKILKSFEKNIKGNAFLLDGSTETKMQLPKTATTTQSLGLSQRFLLFQLLIPFTRSFSIEIGFSDFQKIRRRFVVASAFRETVMTSLHVQIPFGASVTRDQWINLVFDLQALTEAYFPGSTFRSMESICISGSCKLKRVFTMKDAPTWSQGGQAEQKRMAGGIPVASFADAKDIPKQFVFTSSSSGACPIPTEYFVLAGNSSTNSAAVDTKESSSSANVAAISKAGLLAAVPSGQARGKSAPASSSALKKVVAGTTRKSAATRPASGAVRPEPTRPPSRSDRQAIDRSPPKAAVETTDQRRETSRSGSSSRPSSSRSIGSSRSSLASHTCGSEPHSSRSPHRSVARTDTKAEGTPPSSDTKRQKNQNQKPTNEYPEEHRARNKHVHSSSSDDDALEERQQQGRLSDDDEMHPSPLHSTHRSPSVIRTGKESHRRAIFAEIQQKLDSLSKDDAAQSARHTNLFLQHTSIRHQTHALEEENEEEVHRGHADSDHEEEEDEECDWHANSRPSSLFGRKTDKSSSNVERDTRTISSLRRSEDGKPPTRLVSSSSPSLVDPPTTSDRVARQSRSSQLSNPIVIAKTQPKSIFSFPRDSGGASSSEAQLDEEPTATPITETRHRPLTKKLFDFESLLAPTSGAERERGPVASPVMGRASPTTADFNPPSDGDEEDRALADLLDAKRKARRQTSRNVDAVQRHSVEGSTRRHVKGPDDDRVLSVEDLTAALVHPTTTEGGGEDEEERELDGFSIAQHTEENRFSPADSEEAARFSLGLDEREEEVHREDPVTNMEDVEQEEDDDEDNLSIDMTEHLDGNGRLSASSRGTESNRDDELSENEERGDAGRNVDADADNRSQHSDDDGDTSFDFDDLVDEKDDSAESDDDDLDTSVPETKAKATPQKTTPPIVADQYQHQQQHAMLRNSGSQVSSNQKKSATSSNQSRLPASSSPQRRSGKESSRESAAETSFSSSRRLASLLESTDWSQLEPPPRRSSSSTNLPMNKSRSASNGSNTQASSAGASSIELIYDPLLNCYYDPVANKYYTLAK